MITDKGASTEPTLHLTGPQVVFSEYNVSSASLAAWPGRSAKVLPEEVMAYQETFVQRDQHRIYVRDHPGSDPPIIVMHGFPDNLHLYDRLLPHLSPPRRVVAFDFLGWGNSDKPTGYPYTTANQVGDIDAVISQLKLGPAVLVVHDASGPPGIDWALAHPERVAGLALLNTYYCDMPTLRRPEAIWLFSTPVIRSVARPVSRMFGNWLFRRMYWWQVGRFIRDADVRREFVPRWTYEPFTLHIERKEERDALHRSYGIAAFRHCNARHARQRAGKA